MKLNNAYVPLGFAWSSPFAKWQTSLSEVNSLDLLHAVTERALADRNIAAADASGLVLGWTVPQQGSFYGAPTLAARLNAPDLTGPMISQACATSAACVRTAAAELTASNAADQWNLVVAADRTSNSPLLVYPSQRNQGGAPNSENWVLENFRQDPWAEMAMIDTAEMVARKGGFTRRDIDEATALRHQQYTSALADDRAFQRRYMVPVEFEGKRGVAVHIDSDQGVRISGYETLAALRPAVDGGLLSYAAQTHPADGCAGLVVAGREAARTFSSEGAAEILAIGQARLGKGEMPMAPVPAARQALEHAGLTIDDVDEMTSHNPFVVNDLWFASETGYPLERMNRRGSSLVFGHPQAPTGLRLIAELIEVLRERGGGVGLFTGCAAGDSAMAVVLRVDG